MFRSFIIKVFILLSFYIGYGQVLNTEELNNADITAIAKDNFGRAWFGTSKGLYSYDGYDVYKFDAESSPVKLSNNSVTGLVYNQVSRKMIVTTNNGINFFDPDSITNAIVYIDSKTNSNATNHVMCPYIDSIGNVWCTNRSGNLIRIDPARKVKIYYLSVPVPIGHKPQHGQNVLIDKITIFGKQIYFSSLTLVCSFSEETSRVTIVSRDHRAVSGLFVEKNKGLAICDFSGIHKKAEGDSTDKKFVPLHLINNTFKDKYGDVWMVVNGTQIFKIEKNLKPLLVFELDIEKINKHKAITAIYVGSKRIWIGTQRGFIMVNKPLKAFEKVFENLSGYLPVEMSSRGIIRKNDSTIICAGYNYLARYNPLTGASTTLLSKEAAKALIPYGLELTGDSLWIATEGRGFRLMDLKTTQLKPITYKNKIPAEYYANGGLLKWVRKVDSILFLGEYGLMGVYNLRTKEIFDCDIFKWKYTWFNDKARGVNQFLELKSREFAFVTGGNVVITDRSLKVKDVVKLADQKKDNTTPITIVNVSQSSDQKLWLSTLGNGICCYNRESRQAQWYRTDNGLSDNTVYYSLQSNDGKIWVATNYGLSVIDQKENVINSYFERDGLCNNEFNTNSYYKDPSGDLYLGGMKGVTRVIPSLLKNDKEVENLLLTSIEIAGKSVADSLIIGNLRDLDLIRLPYDSRYLSARFSLLNYSFKNVFKFRLIGMDTNWVNLGNNNSVVFNSLSPGSYTLEIRAWNDRGNQVAGGILIPIEAEQIFYKKLWFIIALFLSSTFIIAFIFYSIYRLKLKNISQMAEMRLKIAADLHDQVGGLLNKTATQAEMVQRKLQDKDDSLGKIADNSRVALNSMRDILWNLDPRNDTPESLIDRMNEYAHKMLEDTNMYEMDLNDLKTVKLSNEVRQTIITVFKESITNITKHAPGEKVKVSIVKNGNDIRISVFSTGDFKGNKVHTGQGMKNMKMRMEKIGGTFSIETEKGVFVVFKVPLKES